MHVGRDQAVELEGVLSATPGAKQTLDSLAGSDAAAVEHAVREAFVSALGTSLKISARAGRGRDRAGHRPAAALQRGRRRADRRARSVGHSPPGADRGRGRGPAAARARLIRPAPAGSAPGAPGRGSVPRIGLLPDQISSSASRLGAAAQNAFEVARFGGLETDEQPSPFEVVARAAGLPPATLLPESPAGPPVLLVPPMMLAADVYDVRARLGAP